MTVALEKIPTRLEVIELTEDRVEVKLSAGSVLVDDDVKNESRQKGRMPTVDFFVKAFDPEGSPDNEKVIVRQDADPSCQERFMANASLFGSVREKVADLEELQKAQQMFNFARSNSDRVIKEFGKALEQGKVTQSKQGELDYVQLSYTSPRGETMTCVASYSEGNPRRLTGFYIEDTIGGPDTDRFRVLVKDPVILDSLRTSMEPLIQRR